MKRQCNYCQREYMAQIRYLNRGQGVYCTQSCASRANQEMRRPKPNVQCAMCGKAFYKAMSKQVHSRSGLFFCTRSCKDRGQRIGGIQEIQPPHYKGEITITSYREYALRAYPHICMSCGYKGNLSMLEVDHIDSNRDNNVLENLQILCAWCHTIKTRKASGVHESPGPYTPDYSKLFPQRHQPMVQMVDD